MCPALPLRHSLARWQQLDTHSPSLAARRLPPTSRASWLGLRRGPPARPSAAGCSGTSIDRPSRFIEVGADRAHERRDLRARRARLHARLRHHRADQLRPRRHVHARHVRDAVDRRRGRFQIPLYPTTLVLGIPLGTAAVAVVARAAGVHGRHGARPLDAALHGHQRDHRALRLQAAAQPAAPRAADHRDRLLVHPPEHRAHLEGREPASRCPTSSRTERLHDARRRVRLERRSSWSLVTIPLLSS